MTGMLSMNCQIIKYLLSKMQLGISFQNLLIGIKYIYFFFEFYYSWYGAVKSVLKNLDVFKIKYYFLCLFSLYYIQVVKEWIYYLIRKNVCVMLFTTVKSLFL